MDTLWYELLGELDGDELLGYALLGDGDGDGDTDGDGEFLISGFGTIWTPKGT